MSFRKSIGTLSSAFIEKAKLHFGAEQQETVEILALHLECYAQKELDYEELCLVFEEFIALHDLYDEFIACNGRNQAEISPTTRLEAPTTAKSATKRLVEENPLKESAKKRPRPDSKIPGALSVESLTPEMTPPPSGLVPEVGSGQRQSPKCLPMSIIDLAPLNDEKIGVLKYIVESLAKHTDSRDLLYGDTTDDSGLLLPLPFFAEICNKTQEGQYGTLSSLNRDMEEMFTGLESHHGTSVNRARKYYQYLVAYYFPESISRGRTRGSKPAITTH
ncbi:hypothetical protein HDU91_000077 [Kappamyces sp. JEL0680]|nr:hypothetical protein HDU91_000077 [Kappamyces sp. JEL0680]